MWDGQETKIAFSWIAVGPLVGGQLEPSVTQLEESVWRARDGLVYYSYNSGSDIIFSTVNSCTYFIYPRE